MPPARARPGFTLVELVIALAVTSIALLGALVASTSQQRAYTSGQKIRSAQANARAALLYLEQKLPMAGWGMDPSLAIDFQFYGGPCPAAVGTCSRDRTDDADELVFYARNPAYWVPPEGQTGALKGKVWSFVGISGTNAQLDVRSGDVFAKGQILQVVCPSELRYAYFTVGTRTVATADEAAMNVPLVTADAADPFKRQDVATGLAGCRAFQIDRFRFHVRPVSAGASRYVPYLVLDRGIDWTGSSDGTPDGNVDEKDEILVAEGIEGFQVAYALANPALGQPGASAAITFGTTVAATQAQSTAGDILKTNFTGALNGTTSAVYAPSSFYTYRYSDPIRQTAHQANIRAVRVALLARSPEPDPTATANLVVGSSFRMLNQSGAPTWITSAPKNNAGTDGYQRVLADATVNLPNLVVRSLPAY